MAAAHPIRELLLNGIHLGAVCRSPGATRLSEAYCVDVASRMRITVYMHPIAPEDQQLNRNATTGLTPGRDR